MRKKIVTLQHEIVHGMRKPNYDKVPSTAVSGHAAVGWDTILGLLQNAWEHEPVWAIDLYVGSYEEDFLEAFRRTGRVVIDVRLLMKPEDGIRCLTERFMTDDVLFGYMSNIRLEEYFEWDRVEALRNQLGDGREYVVVGTGAGYVTSSDVPVVYADLARWEIQQRFRRQFHIHGAVHADGDRPVPRTLETVFRRLRGHDPQLIVPLDAVADLSPVD